MDQIAKAGMHQELVELVEKNVHQLETMIGDHASLEVRETYECIRNVLLEPRFDLLRMEDFDDDMLFQSLCTIRKHDHQTIHKLAARKLIVSLTTYPARIGTLHQVLQTIYAQTHPADEVILWLAEEQFPGKEEELPEQLYKWTREGKLTIRWCDDLKPHKKYFYALQEHPDDLVVTVDDDMLYPVNLLDRLWRSYLCHPNAVSAGRAHLMVLSENGNVLPYDVWARETDMCIHEPSMQLLAVGCGGVLYPAELFRKEFFDKEAIMQTCLWADDLWLKAMELASDVPVVVAQRYDPVPYVPGSQETALYLRNVDGNENDIQFAKISQWMDTHIEEGVFENKLTQSPNGVTFRSVEAVCRHFGSERRALRSEIRRLNEEKQARWTELQELRKLKGERWNQIQKLNKEMQVLKEENRSMRRKLSRTGIYSEGVVIFKFGPRLTRLINKIKAWRDRKQK